jgi:hypothetical protein
MEPLEDRQLLALLINELHFDPLFGNPDKHQFVELRGDPLATIDEGTYLVVADGDWLNEGNIHTVFDLSGQTLGSNGFLVLLQHDHPYDVHPDANALVSTTSGFSGLPDNMFSDDSSISSRIDFIWGSNTFFLVQSDVAPTVADDMDLDDDGIPDGVYENWNVLDSVGVLTFGGYYDKVYGDINFRYSGFGTALAGTTVVDVNDDVSYVARISDSTGWAAADWVGGNVRDFHGEPKFRFTHGTFGDPQPMAFAGRELDHVGTTNFFGAVSGTVFEDTNGDGVQDAGESGIPNVTVYTDQNDNGIRDTVRYHLEPEMFPSGTELTNKAIGATLTVARSNNTVIGFNVRSDFDSGWTEQWVFSSEGIPWFSNSGRLRIDFYEPAAEVTIDAIGSSSLSDMYGRLEAFNADGESLGFVRSVALRQKARQTLRITRPQGDIAYAVAFADNSFLRSSPFGRFDHLTYRLPEHAATTDANGDYMIDYLDEDVYVVRMETPNGKVQTSPPGTGAHQKTVVGTSHLRDANFGIRSNAAPEIDAQTFDSDEALGNGDVVGAVVAADDDVGQAVTFTIVGGTGAGIFSIHPTTGVITVADAVALDFETDPSLTLEVKVEDDYDPPKSSIATVTIDVKDTNEAPVIAEDSFSLNEDATNGASVGTVVAVDQDAGLAGEFTFSIVNGDDQGIFQINPATGQITVANDLTLDFETTSRYDLVVKATDKGTPVRARTRTIPISIGDVNEAPGVTSGQVFYVEENAPLGTLVGHVDVSDPDANQTFTFLATGGDTTVFEVDAATGEVTVLDSTALDFETQNEFTLDIRVTDNGGPTLSGSGTVTIKIPADLNEDPSIDADTFALDENAANGTSVGSVTAADPDSGQTLEYTITGGTGQEAFAVNATTGEITVADASLLDFEATNSLELTVQVQDDGLPRKADSATITIDLNDLNESPSLVSHVFAVPENSTEGTQVGTVDADDPDANADLTFEITGGSGAGVFDIDGDTGQLSVVDHGPLDHETTQAFDLEIKVTDQGGLIAEATTTISITDVNEADPVLDDANFAVDENAQEGTVVDAIAGTDADSNQMLRYTITDGNENNAFAVDAVTGQIVVHDSDALDHESRQSYSLVVTATDNGSPERADTATVTIVINDVNEYIPSMEGASFAINENSSVGVVVGSINAVDADSSQTLTYTISSGNFIAPQDGEGEEDEPDPVFTIDPVTGVISVETPSLLDHEANPEFVLTVDASDDGSPMRGVSATVKVTVADVNEYSPEISDQAFQVDENRAFSTVIGSVVATDQDTSQSLTYEIESGNDNDAFAIDAETGELTVNSQAALNHEDVQEQKIRVKATDTGNPTRSQSAIMTIAIDDINEFAPEISDRTFELDENKPAGFLVGTAEATDEDANQTLTFSITDGNQGEAFTIEPSTGRIRVNTPSAVDHETTPTFELTVQVSDDVEPIRTRTGTITIHVHDSNEFAPEIANQSFSVVEGSPAGTVVGAVVASDEDAAQTISYSILANNANVFAINSTTGVITVLRPDELDYEAGTSFELTVQATDNGSPPLSSTATITIDLEDANEFTPEIENQSFSIAENSPVETWVGRVDASDQDSSQTLNFVITAGDPNEVFSLEPTTGDIFVRSDMDYESTPQYQLRVQVVDSGEPFRAATATIVINITDANEHAPSIVSSAFSIAENAPPNSIVGTVIAQDDDSAQSISFEIVGGNESNAFSIDPMSGTITATTLDREMQAQYQLEVEATDSGTPAISSTATIAIDVSDVNEPPTSIELDPTTIDENDAGGTVGAVVVDDPDNGDSHTFEVSDARFEVAGGQLKLNDGQMLDFEAEPSISLEITALDSGEPALEVRQTFTISVQDINEPPTEVSLSNTEVDEGSAGAVIGDLAATDPDPLDKHTFTVDDERFEVVNGQLKLKEGVSLDRTAAETVVITVTATDSGTPAQSLEQQFDITVLAVVDPWTNPANAMDVNNDGSLSSIDALIIINELNDPEYSTGGGGLPETRDDDAPFYDVNRDGSVAPIDALILINELNDESSGEGEQHDGFDHLVAIILEDVWRARRDNDELRELQERLRRGGS